MPHHDPAGMEFHLFATVDEPRHGDLTELGDEIWRDEGETFDAVLKRHWDAGSHEDSEEEHPQDGPPQRLVLGDGSGCRERGVCPQQVERYPQHHGLEPAPPRHMIVKGGCELTNGSDEDQVEEELDRGDGCGPLFHARGIGGIILHRGVVHGSSSVRCRVTFYGNRASRRSHDEVFRKPEYSEVT